jgi:pSer/pThr/pTyr-binding forkhead associated (FHA) protein
MEAEKTTPQTATLVSEPAPARLAEGAKPKLVVMRGQRLNAEYPIYEGDNYIGRADEKPVDVDLEDQEPPDRIWSSRQHALLTYENGQLAIEDLNSLNGTFVNRTRVTPGQKRPLQVNDLIQIGTVHLKVKV